VSLERTEERGDELERVPDGPPVELSRDELDRVIRRAAELQFAGSGEEPGSRLSEAEVLRIGREVGLEPRHVRRAMGELRAESLLPVAGGDEGLLGRLVGSSLVSASRVVKGEIDPLTRGMENYLEVGESLRQLRKRGRHSRWEAAEGMIASLQRGLRWGGRKYELAQARYVELNLEPVGDDQVLVALQADLSSMRVETVSGWTAGLSLGGAGVGFAAGVVLAGPILAVPGAVLGMGAGIASARRDFRGRTERIRMVMEGILDRLESGSPLLSESPSWRDRWLQS